MTKVLVKCPCGKAAVEVYAGFKHTIYCNFCVQELQLAD
jgi:hypothetical protein